MKYLPEIFRLKIPILRCSNRINESLGTIYNICYLKHDINCIIKPFFNHIDNFDACNGLYSSEFFSFQDMVQWFLLNCSNEMPSNFRAQFSNLGTCCFWFQFVRIVFAKVSLTSFICFDYVFFRLWMIFTTLKNTTSNLLGSQLDWSRWKSFLCLRNSYQFDSSGCLFSFFILSGDFELPIINKADFICWSLRKFHGHQNYNFLWFFIVTKPISLLRFVNRSLIVVIIGLTLWNRRVCITILCI